MAGYTVSFNGVLCSLLVVGLCCLNIAGAQNCDLNGILLYEDMGCKPIHERGLSSKQSCPIRYDCLGLKKSPSNCFLKGKVYEIGDPVDSRITASNCDLGCSCQKDHNDRMKFKCGMIDCPEWTVKQPAMGCYRRYSLEDCCSVREMCSPYDNSTTCLYEGKLYKEGENFFPQNTCWRCVCQAGFRGKLEKPFCRRKSCGVQVKYQDKLQNRCAPLYYKSKYKQDDPLCCPVNWICSEDDEKITGYPSSDKKCFYGQKVIRGGQKFEKVVQMARNMTVTCECTTPPLLTCITYVA